MPNPKRLADKPTILAGDVTSDFKIAISKPAGDKALQINELMNFISLQTLTDVKVANIDGANKSVADAINAINIILADLRFGEVKYVFSTVAEAEAQVGESGDVALLLPNTLLVWDNVSLTWETTYPEYVEGVPSKIVYKEIVDSTVIDEQASQFSSGLFQQFIFNYTNISGIDETLSAFQLRGGTLLSQSRMSVIINVNSVFKASLQYATILTGEIKTFNLIVPVDIPIGANLQIIISAYQQGTYFSLFQDNTNIPYYQLIGKTYVQTYVEAKGGYIEISDPVVFTTTGNETIPEGGLSYNADEQTWSFGVPSGHLDLNEEIILPRRPKNVSGVQMVDGDVVYISDAQGGIPYVDLAIAANYEIAIKSIAMVTIQSVNDNARGRYTTFGIVNGLNTIGYAEGTVVYLSATTAGKFTAIKPTYPNIPVEIGVILKEHATAGSLFVDIKFLENEFITAATKESTGFVNTSDVIVTDNGNRTITITGDTKALYRNEPVAALISGWTSSVHTDDQAKRYFLTYNGIDVAWRDITSTPPDMTHVMICYAFYRNGVGWLYLRETHGLMNYLVHQEFHNTIGTYRTSGGDISGVTLSSTTSAQRRPDVSDTQLHDEDCSTLNAAFTSKLYTWGSYGIDGKFIFEVDKTEFVNLSTNNPFYNDLIDLVDAQTLLPANSIMTVWLVAIPMVLGSTSQKIRYVFIQGQSFTQAANSSAPALATARAAEEAKSFGSLNLGDLTNVLPEMVVLQKFIIQFTTNWTIENSIRLSGTRYTQIATASGSFLTSVSVDGTTITGDGTPSNPLVSLVGLSVYDPIAIDISAPVVNITNTTGDALQGATSTEGQKSFIDLPYNCEILGWRWYLDGVDSGTKGWANLQIVGQAGNVFLTNTTLSTASTSAQNAQISATNVNTLYNKGTKGTRLQLRITAGQNLNARGGTFYIDIIPN